MPPFPAFGTVNIDDGEVGDIRAPLLPMLQNPSSLVEANVGTSSPQEGFNDSEEYDAYVTPLPNALRVVDTKEECNMQIAVQNIIPSSNTLSSGDGRVGIDYPDSVSSDN